MPPRLSLPVGAALVAGVVLAVGAATLLPGAAPAATAEALPAYGSCDALLADYRNALARTATPYGPSVGTGGEADVRAVSSSSVATSGARAEAGPLGPVGPGPTGTNLQEQGVDEPDLVKLSGDLLLAVAGGRLQVIRAGAQPSLVTSLSLSDDAALQGGPGRWAPHAGAGAELLVQGDRVLVLQGGELQPGELPGASGGAADTSRPGPATTGVELVLVDLADPERPAVLERLQLDGRYVSARLSGGSVRVVTTSGASYEPTFPAEPFGRAQEQEALAANIDAARHVTLAQVLPQQRRSTGAGLVLERGPAVACEQVRHAQQGAGGDTLLVTTLDLRRGLAAVDRTGVRTSGELVYAAPERLYVATSRWDDERPAFSDPVQRAGTGTLGGTGTPAGTGEPAGTGTPAGTASTTTTELHGFDTATPGSTRYLGSGSVQGYVLGRWALSAHEGHLRVATTSTPPWEQQRETSSGVLVLAERDGALVPTGRVDGLGEGERIYAVRYFGDLATVVTFRETDPLYVLDLADPMQPRLLGELKVPGFSDYLHPVGDDRLLGIGSSADPDGRVTGLQAQLFDLSALTRPRSSGVLRLSAGAAWTPVADDSRAFAYDASRRLALLPVSSWDRTPGNAAVGVRVGADGTLSEVGRLTVLGLEPVQRVLTRDGVVYAVTARGIVAGRADTFARTGVVAYPA